MKLNRNLKMVKNYKIIELKKKYIMVFNQNYTKMVEFYKIKALNKNHKIMIFNNKMTFNKIMKFNNKMTFNNKMKFNKINN